MLGATSAPVANTVGVIARRFGVTRDQVDYVVKSRGIRPAALAGHIRLFDDAAAERVGEELRSIERRRELATR